MTKGTRAKWAERIREWQASGLSAEDFTMGKDYEGSSLRWAASQLGAEKTSRPAAEANSGAKAPRFVPVRMRSAGPAVGEVVVEVGGARIRVTRGMDVALLGDIVRALQGVGR
jgi:hypothetical protein